MALVDKGLFCNCIRVVYNSFNRRSNTKTMNNETKAEIVANVLLIVTLSLMLVFLLLRGE